MTGQIGVEGILELRFANPIEFKASDSLSGRHQYENAAVNGIPYQPLTMLNGYKTSYLKIINEDVFTLPGCAWDRISCLV